MKFPTRVAARYQIKAVPLQYSERQRQDPIESYEGIAFYEIEPMEFLLLTTEDEAHRKAILEEAQTLDVYNKDDWGAQHPYLTINPEGKVQGHEGRHRAAALYLNHEDRFRIALAAQEQAYPHKDYGWRWKRHGGKLPVPEYLIGQFTNYRHKVDRSRIEIIQRGEWYQDYTLVGPD
jgi:hypothetical protein